MSRPYTHVQGLLPSVLAMKEEGYTYRQIAKQFGLTKEQVEELCSRARRKQRRIEKGYIPQPKGRPRKRRPHRSSYRITESSSLK